MLAKLRRFYDCAEDFESGGVDIGRHWLDLLTQLGLLNRVQRSPALWEISQQGEDLLGTPHPSPAQAEQAEAERPEVVDFNPYRYHAEKIRQRADGAASAYEAGRSALGYMEDIAESALIVRNGLDELSAQHERITAKLHDALDESDGDRWKMRSERDAANARLHEVATACATAEQERDAALAEVERLRESKGDPSGSFDRCMNMMYERDENAKRLDAALARVAELEAALSSALSQHGIKFMDPPDGGDTPLIEQVCRMSQALAELEKQESVAWVEVIDRDYGPYKFYGKRLLPKGKHQLYAAPVAQAQHSVPEVSGIGRDFAYPRSVVLYLRTEPTDDDLRAIHDGLRSLAAAPGKEVPQAWLDVQAERRRQVEAEGWTPEHDDEHADGQMAQAAGCYALHAGGIGTDWPDGRQNGSALFWPWDKDSWKPTTPRRDLVKACALALAEIERLDRAGISQSPQPGATTASS
ncbi:hypothetical protein P7I93_13310 [Pseudomonas aeruginosa]|uniref:hypothetical protein n=1 Tax=Pseudomonas aeruginosa TaxID=287 RepID=UPI00249E9706|nr:hypothetical protein [Pseudomonas aeruginosa]WGX57860.1 hypothetical protein P7I93_13310 [Pseudomonas aeruginosa]